MTSIRISVVAVAHCAVQFALIFVCGIATPPRENHTGVAPPTDWIGMITGQPLLSRISTRVFVAVEVLDTTIARISLYPPPLRGTRVDRKSVV